MKQQKIIAALLISWLCGLSCCRLFTCSHTTAPSTVSVAAKTMAEQVRKEEASYQTQTIQWLRQNEQLDKTIQQTTVLLAATTKDNNRLRTSLQQLLTRQQEYSAVHDTINSISGCDALRVQTAAYITATVRQDSMQEQVNHQLVQQVQNADTVINLQEQRYSMLRQQFDKSLATQTAIETQAAGYKRIIKKQQRNNKLMRIGITVLAAISLTQLLR